jgi:acetaldehyde dehydrogenase (acetylating)
MLLDKDLLSIQEVRTKVDKAYAAWQKYQKYSQEQVDAIVERMAAVARANARQLAEMAVEETGYGNVPDKTAKNLLTSDLLPRRMRGMKTIGVLRELPEQQIVEIGVPAGVVAAILPTTNPTSTAIYKTLVAMKAGNAVVISPHPRAHKCTCYTAGLLYQAAIEAGAPEDIIQCIDTATLEGTLALMRHERTSIIMATGGASMVKAAYSSGKPAFGVGPGNVPAFIDTSADVDQAVDTVIAGKSFDYGTVCSSEQALVAEASLRDRILARLKTGRAYIATEQQGAALGKILMQPNWTVNPQCVGQSPVKIAQLAGFSVPADTSIIAVEVGGVGKNYPLSAEKLSPVLSLFFVKDYAAALDTCWALLKFGGLGHTCVIHAKDPARIREYGLRMPAMRVLVNTSGPQGSTGITTDLFPAMTLGCGAAAGNITSDNVSPLHLLNIKRIASVVRTPEEAFEGPAAAESSSGSIERQTVAAAVERFLASRGLGQAAPFSAYPPASAPGLPVAPRTPAAEPAPVAPPVFAVSAESGPSCARPSASGKTCAPPSLDRSVVANIAAEVIERFLARRAAAAAAETPEAKQNSEPGYG